MSDFKEIAASIGYPQFSSSKDFPLRPFFNGTPRPPLLVIATQTATHCNCNILAHNPCQATLRSLPWTGYYRTRPAARRGSRATLFSCNTGLQYTATRCNVLQPQRKKENNALHHTATHIFCIASYSRVTFCWSIEANTPQRTATYWNILEHTVTHCHALQRAETSCIALHHAATLWYCIILHHTNST